MDYLKTWLTFNKSNESINKSRIESNESINKSRIEEITQLDYMETPLQIISDIALWKEIIMTYNLHNVDIHHVCFHEDHFSNGVVHYFETGDLRFNLKTLKPCKKSFIQDKLDPGLVLRIQNNPAYQKFSQENISFGSCSTHFDLMQLQSDYLDNYFDLEYDHRLTSDNMFRNLSEEDRINFINSRHQKILNNCEGLRFNI